jgi:RNA polymerase sigma-70 factor (ECF subfamily)
MSRPIRPAAPIPAPPPTHRAAEVAGPLFTPGPKPAPVIREARGETDEIERIYREHGGRMWRAALGFTRDPELASDAVAEAFAQALRRGGELRDPERWIWRTIFRVAAGALKERGRMTETAVPEAAYELEEPTRDLVAALGHLSRNQRAAVVMHDALGYSSNEIAEAIGSTSAAVRVHLMRARRRLRALLEDDPVG